MSQLNLYVTRTLFFKIHINIVLSRRLDHTRILTPLSNVLYEFIFPTIITKPTLASIARLFTKITKIKIKITRITGKYKHLDTFSLICGV